MEVFQNVLNLLRTAISGLSDLVSWFVNFSFTIPGWSFDLFGLHLEFVEFNVHSGILLTAGFLSAVVTLLIIHLVNVIASSYLGFSLLEFIAVTLVILLVLVVISLNRGGK